MFLDMDAVKINIYNSLNVIKMYDWLLDLYVLDFFVENHWEKLPLSWRQYFETVDPQEIGKTLSGVKSNHVLPLSFLTLIATINTLSLPRQPCSDTKLEKSRDKNICDHQPPLKNLFLKHVKLKKRHEISLMANVVAEVSKKCDCSAVLDFGSGLGHLARVLGYKHGLYTAGIECQTTLTEEARRLDLELEYSVKKFLTPDSVSNLKRPIHINMMLSSESVLSELLLPGAMKHYGLVGLHPCGDLGPLLLRHFVKSPHVKFICVVGCCYMKLTCNGSGSGYPMSKYIQELNSSLSYVSREIACHAIEVYTERLRHGSYENLKVHAYRAALERILVEHDVKLRHAPVRSIKHYNTMTFQKYCSLALEKIHLPLPAEGGDAGVWTRGERDLLQWRRVVTVYTLRLVLAPIVETVVLLDRVLFIMEHGLSCEIHPVFDPKISPRNHIIIAKK